MGLFNFFGTGKPQEPNNRDKSEMKERLMKTLTEKLSTHKFTKLEIKEVFDIIELAEADIRGLKDTLAQIKLTNQDPQKVITKVKKEIEAIQTQMAADIKAKIQQIKKRKDLYKRSL